VRYPDRKKNRVGRWVGSGVPEYLFLTLGQYADPAASSPDNLISRLPSRKSKCWIAVKIEVSDNKDTYTFRWVAGKENAENAFDPAFNSIFAALVIP
jgi:hypothetical protein